MDLTKENCYKIPEKKVLMMVVKKSLSTRNIVNRYRRFVEIGFIDLSYTIEIKRIK